MTSPPPAGPAVPDRGLLREALVDHLEQHPGGGVALLLLDPAPTATAGAGLPDGGGTTPAHDAELRRQVQARLASTVRDGDLLVQLPGGELALIVHGADAATARDIGQRLLAVLAPGLVVGGAMLDVATSVGGSSAPAGAAGRRPSTGLGVGAVADRLLQEADAALSAARRTGAGVAVVEEAESAGTAVTDARQPGGQRGGSGPGEEPGPRVVGSRSLDELDALKAALAGPVGPGDGTELLGEAGADALEVLHQPRFDVRTGRWAGVGTQVRWRSPLRGPLDQQALLDLADGTGLGEPLVLAVLDRALADADGWAERGHLVQVAVAVPARTLVRPSFPGAVEEVLRLRRVPPGGLRLVVDEDAIGRDPAGAAVALARLRAAGAAVSVDGVGAGRSSVFALAALPVDELVVDRTPVAGLASSTAARAADERLVRAVVGLGHGLGHRVVATGVVDVAAHRSVVAAGCDVVQGDHVVEALAAPEVTRLLEGLAPVGLRRPPATLVLPGQRRPQS